MTITNVHGITLTFHGWYSGSVHDAAWWGMATREAWWHCNARDCWEQDDATILADAIERGMSQLAKPGFSVWDCTAWLARVVRFLRGDNAALDVV